MRIKRCQIKAFGQFRDRTFADLNHPLVVIQGKNEAGKSTFFQFLRSMLYGFHPDQPERFKYTPLDGTAIEGEIALSLSDADELAVSRRLDKAPSGFLLNGTSDELGNRSLPVLDHIPRPVFESVYTLGLYDLIEFSGDAWEKIQDRLLGSLNAGYIRPAYEAIRALREEAAALWRKDGQGDSQTQRLETLQRALKKEAFAARENDERIRVLFEEIDAHRHRELELESEQIRLKAERRRIKRLAPVLRLVDKIKQLRDEAGDLEPYRLIPEDSHMIVDALSEQIRKDQDKLEYTKRDIRLVQEQIQKIGRNLFIGPLSKEIVQALRALPEVELRHRVFACQEALSSLREVQMYAKMLTVRVSVSKPLYPWIVVVLLASIMVVCGIVFGMAWLWMSGSILFLFSGFQGLEVLRHNRAIGYDEAEAWPDVSDFEIEADIQKQAIAELLEGIPLPTVRLETPDHDLLADIVSIKTALDGYDMKVRQYVELEKEFKMRNRSTLAKIKELKDPLMELGEGDLHRGVQRLQERRKALRKALQYEETLEQDYPTWLDMLAEIETIRADEGDIVFSDEDVVRTETRLDQIETELKEIVATRTEKSKDIERLRGERPVDAVESEIALVRERMQELKKRHDRLQLLAHLIEKADEQFRMKHQPEVIRLAGEYLAQVTDNRYTRLGIDEESGNLMVYEHGTDRSFPVGPPLSQGTCDQIFLAIRLAIIDHLDEGRERIPVFLDEVFVNWDEGRRKNVYGILRKMSEKRQVFLFTCHNWQAEEAVRELGAHNIVLSPIN